MTSVETEHAPYAGSRVEPSAGVAIDADLGPDVVIWPRTQILEDDNWHCAPTGRLDLETENGWRPTR